MHANALTRIIMIKIIKQTSKNENPSVLFKAFFQHMSTANQKILNSEAEPSLLLQNL